MSGRAKAAKRVKAAKRPEPKAVKTKSKTAKTKSKTAKTKTSALGGAAFEKVRALALALPDTKLTMTWGSPHFRVGEKIFCGFGSTDGKQVLGVKLEMSHARSAVKDPRFWPSPYVGKHGWVSMDVTRRKSWDEVAALIRESYD